MELSSSSAAASAKADEPNSMKKILAMPAYAKNIAKDLSEAESSLQSSLPMATSDSGGSPGAKHAPESSSGSSDASGAPRAKPCGAGSAMSASSPAATSLHLDVAESAESNATVAVDDQFAAEAALPKPPSLT